MEKLSVGVTVFGNSIIKRRYQYHWGVFVTDPVSGLISNRVILTFEIPQLQLISSCVPVKEARGHLQIKVKTSNAPCSTTPSAKVPKPETPHNKIIFHCLEDNRR